MIIIIKMSFLFLKHTRIILWMNLISFISLFFFSKWQNFLAGLMNVPFEVSTFFFFFLGLLQLWHFEVLKYEHKLSSVKGSNPKTTMFWIQAAQGNRRAKLHSHFMFHMLPGPHTAGTVAHRSPAYTPSTIYTFVGWTLTWFQSWNKSQLMLQWHLNHAFISVWICDSHFWWKYAIR